MRTYAFIDAANLFYGGEKSLGWSIDYKKLAKYLEERYGVSRIHYFGGVELYNFPFDYLNQETVPIEDLEKYLVSYITKKTKNISEARLILLNRHLKQVRFYKKLEKFGYHLVLKPVKFYRNIFGGVERKANCDVDMVFHLLRELHNYDRLIFLSGDGDFLPVLRYIKKRGKEIYVLARAPRTAREIKKFAAEKFMDFTYLREILKFESKK